MGKTLRVLIVDDVELDAELIVRELSHDYDLTYERVDTSEAMNAALDRGPWDVILCDYGMPHFDAWTALAVMRGKGLDLPFIVVTGTMDYVGAAVECVRSGAHDFILKRELGRLRTTVAREIQAARDRAREHELGQRTLDLETTTRGLEWMAFHDVLTGCYNRRYFDMHLSKEVARARRYDRPFSLVLVDVDNFKQVNDTYGHSVGDLVLSHLARRLESQLRESDEIARYGGDEFGILCVEVGDMNGKALAERLRTCVTGTPFPLVDLECPVTISLGGATVGKDGDFKNEIDLVKAADLSLYRSKEAGRNRCSWWENDHASPTPRT